MSKPTRTLRKYEELWRRIKVMPIGQSVSIRVHQSACRSVIQGLKKEKSRDVSIKKKIGMLYAGQLTIVTAVDPKDQQFRIVSFSLKNDWSRI